MHVKALREGGREKRGAGAVVASHSNGAATAAPREQIGTATPNPLVFFFIMQKFGFVGKRVASVVCWFWRNLSGRSRSRQDPDWACECSCCWAALIVGSLSIINIGPRTMLGPPHSR